MRSPGISTGPPRKPDVIRELQGKPGKARPIAKKAPRFETLRELPPAPEDLGEFAQKQWVFYGEQLVATGVLTSADLHVLAAFCNAYERWRECAIDVRVNGSVLEAEGRLIRNPASVAIAEAWKVMRECGALMGLDPANRSKIIADQPEKENPFAALLADGGKNSH